LNQQGSRCSGRSCAKNNEHYGVNATTSPPRPPARRRATLDIVGVIVLVLGLSIATIVLVTGADRLKSATPSGAPGDWQDTTLSIQDSKASSHDLEMYDGKLGMLTLWLSDAFHQPGSLALIIAVASSLVAVGCFYLSHRFPPEPPVGTDDFSS
jgi:hypothetical protein